MMFQEKLNNVSSWLVARFAIVENFLQIILKPHVLFGRFAFVAQKWESLFLEKTTCNC